MSYYKGADVFVVMFLLVSVVLFFVFASAICFLIRTFEIYNEERRPPLRNTFLEAFSFEMRASQSFADGLWALLTMLMICLFSLVAYLFI